MPLYTIGRLARQLGLPISTLRFYERSGLLKPSSRSDGNYRQYDQAALDRLRFIRSAQTTGFSLHDIRQLLRLTHSDRAPCDEVLTLMNNRLAEVRTRLKQLRQVEKVLAKSLTDCCSGKSIDLCAQISQLKTPAESCEGLVQINTPRKKIASRA